MSKHFYKDQLIVVISSPSGAGKTTVCKNILNRDDKLILSISCTTRNPRDNETDGVDYNFISQQEFESKIINKEFLEYAKVFDNFYGSLLRDVNLKLNEGFDVLFDIDWQGAAQISKSKIANIVKIFICPPSKDAVLTRLHKRSEETGDDIESISRRMQDYEKEMEHSSQYNHIIVNDDLSKCILQVEEIIKNERLKLS